MEKKLNIENVNQAMTRAGLTQAAIAQTLGVSREAVSQWINQKIFPRPNKLLQLGKLLSLSFNDIVIKEDVYAPVVAFRKMKGTKTKDHHIEQAQEMGYFLRHLVPYLPFNRLEMMPPVLKKPVCDYHYIQQIVKKVRDDINIKDNDVVNFRHLIRGFLELQTIIIPVLWGSKQRHENAVHIFLPDSQTTWVYLNLDVNIHDFKFWMAHELGHCLSPSLRGDESEDFADEFAAALLFPENEAKCAYEEIIKKHTPQGQLNNILQIARNRIISPYTVYKQINKHAEHANVEPLSLEPQIHGATTNFNKQYHNLSATLFGDTEQLKAKDYIERSQIEFETPFFKALSKYLKEHKKEAGLIQSVMDIPLLDAQSIHEELT